MSSIIVCDQENIRPVTTENTLNRDKKRSRTPTKESLQVKEPTITLGPSTANNILTTSTPQRDQQPLLAFSATTSVQPSTNDSSKTFHQLSSTSPTLDELIASAQELTTSSLSLLSDVKQEYNEKLDTQEKVISQTLVKSVLDTVVMNVVNKSEIEKKQIALDKASQIIQDSKTKVDSMKREENRLKGTVQRLLDANSEQTIELETTKHFAEIERTAYIAQMKEEMDKRGIMLKEREKELQKREEERENQEKKRMANSEKLNLVMSKRISDLEDQLKKKDAECNELKEALAALCNVLEALEKMRLESDGKQVIPDSYELGIKSSEMQKAVEHVATMSENELVEGLQMVIQEDMAGDRNNDIGLEKKN
eukprot:g1420.t1